MRTLGKYEILDELGSGSMGTVYRAHDSVIDREIALKTIRTGIETEPEMRERFYREARSCGRLQHPNIVTIYDLGEEAKTAYIAMELLEGLDFRKLIDQRRELPLTGKLEWMAQVCDALGHAHRHGVIHRDVKPSNLFLMNTGSVKVLDFGIARLTSSRLTLAGRILGTPNYMAPEQILANTCDGRADLFSAGVVFFELLVYEHPFKAAMIANRIVESEPDSLFDYQSDLPPILEKVFARALAKSPDDRYPNAAAFAGDLRAILESLRNQGSLSLLSLDLPSNRTEDAAAAPLPQGSAIEPLPAPEGEDSAEWRNSEVLMLIPQFEKAVGQQDQASAQNFYESLLRVAATDTRYAEAIASCRVRLEQLGSTVGAVKAPVSANPQTQKICAECGAGNRGAARFCIGCGASLEDPAPIESSDRNPIRSVRKSAEEPAGRPFDTFFDRTTIYPPKETPSAKELPKPATPLQGVPRFAEASKIYAVVLLWLRTNRRYVIPGSVVLLAAIIVIVGLLLRRPHHAIEHPVATAKVVSTNMNVYAEGITSKRLYPLKQGDAVNILKLPDSPSQDWVKVQYVIKNEAEAPGVAHRHDLGPMTGLNAGSELAIIRLLYPQPSDEEIKVLKDFAARHPGAPEANDANAEADKLEEILHPPPQPQGCDTACKLGEARKLFDQRHYNEAEEELAKVLGAEPDNLEALKLQGQILHVRCWFQLNRVDGLLLEGRFDDASKIVVFCQDHDPGSKDRAKELWARIGRNLEK